MRAGGGLGMVTAPCDAEAARTAYSANTPTAPSTPEREAPVGVFAKYAVLAASASQGAVTIPNPPPARTADSFPGRPRAASTQTAHEDA